MKIKEKLRSPLALVTVERTEDRELAAMVKLDLDEGGDARYGRIVRYDTYDADELLPAIGDRIVVTAGSDFPQELRMPNSIDILAALGEQTLVDACSRRGIPYKVDAMLAELRLPLKPRQEAEEQEPPTP